VLIEIDEYDNAESKDTVLAGVIGVARGASSGTPLDLGGYESMVGWRPSSV